MHRITTKVVTKVATKVVAKEKRKDEKENEGKKTPIKCHRFEYRPVLALVPCWPCIWPRKNRTTRCTLVAVVVTIGAVEKMEKVEKVEKVLRCGATWPGPVELNQVRYGPIQHPNHHHDLDMHETVVGARVVEEVVASCKTDPGTTRKRRKRRTKTTTPKETGEGEKPYLQFIVS